MRKNLKSTFLAVNLILSVFFGLTLVGSPAPQVLAAGNAYPINLYFHNDTTTPMVGGFIRTSSTLNTTQAWRTQPQAFVNFTSRLARDFYLHPDLAGNFTVNATLWLHPWVVGSGSGGSLAKASFTVAIYDVSPSGQVLISSSSSTGSLNIAFGKSAAQSEDVNGVPGNAPLKFNLASFTYLQGHSILVHVEMLPQGSGTVLSFYYDSQITPSYATLYAQTIVSVANSWTANETGTPTSVFAPTGASLPVQILANVTDPLGGYDLNASTTGSPYARVAVNLTSPTGSQLLTEKRMNLLSGGQTSYSNIFRLNVTLAAPFPGQYNYTIIATDNSDNVALGTGFFHIGQVYRLQAQAIDSKSRPLAGAAIVGKIQDIQVFAENTNASGWIDRLVVSSGYNLSVVWRGTIVNNTLNFAVTQNSTIIMRCGVYDPKFQALDDIGTGLPQAEIFIQSPNGTRTTYPIFTTLTGYVNLTESQAGSYRLTVLWKGVAVYNDSINVNSDGPFAFKTQVYQLTVIAQGADGTKIKGAVIAVHSPTSAEIVYSWGVTNATGAVVFRLPIGQYVLAGYLSTTYLLTSYSSESQQQTITVQSSGPATVTFQGFPPPITSTAAFQLGIILLLLVVLAALIGFFMGRRGRGKPSGKMPEES